MTGNVGSFAFAQIAPTVNLSSYAARFVELDHCIMRMGQARRSAMLITKGKAHFQNLAILREKVFLHSDSRSRNPVGQVLRLGNKVIVRTGSDLQNHGRGIVVGGPSHNWFHWLIEQLPTIHRALTESYDWASWPLVLRREVLERENFVKTLRLVAPESTVVPVDAEAFFRLDRALILEAPTSPGTVDFGLFGNFLKRNHFDLAIMSPYRSKLREYAVNLPRTSHPKRIFLTRSRGRNRPYNQSELIDIAKKFGFKPMNPDEHSLENLWSALAHASVVAGPQGAAWANSIVCPQGAIGIQWNGGSLRGESFQSLASLVGMTMHHLVGEGGFDDGYRIDPKEFERTLVVALQGTSKGRG